MSIKYKDLIIPKGDGHDPFLNCKLDRKKYGEVLTQLVKTYDDGFVLAINNQWGTGKTTFVKMWQQMLEIEQVKTLYFNAWENDFDDKPLHALLSELKTLITSGDKSEIKFKNLVSKASVFLSKVLPSIAVGIAKEIKVNEVLNEFTKAMAEGATEILNNEIQDYAKKKIGLTDFKNNLIEFLELAKGESKSPIVFIIDELDRCRPNYAVKVLEQIKHFFSVDGIVFVLSIDKTQLGHAVRGVYGSEHINADEYLKRFIDIEYSIPEPDSETFINYLYNYHNFDSFFAHNLRLNHSRFGYDKRDFLVFSKFLLDSNKIQLRRQEKIFTRTKLALNQIGIRESSFSSPLFLLIFIKETNDNLYREIKSKKLTPQEFLDKIENMFPSGLEHKDLHTFYFTISYILNFYNRYVGKRDSEELISKFDSKELIRKIELTRTTLTNEDGIGSIKYLLNKIDLLDNLKTTL